MQTSTSPDISSFRALPLFVAACMALFSLSQSVVASTLTWDSGGLSPLAPNSASGTWNLISAYWSNGATDITWINANNDTASFGGATYTVSIANSIAITAGGLTSSGTQVSIGGGTGSSLTLAGSTPTIGGTGSTWLNIALGGSNGLTKSGSGQLRFTVAAAYTGNTSITAGQVSLQAVNSLPVTTAVDMTGTALIFTQGVNQSWAGLTGTSGTTIRNHTSTSATLTITSGTNSFSGKIIDTGTGSTSLVNAGGTLTLSHAANDFKGSTTVSAGTLLVSGGLTATSGIIVSGGMMSLGASEALNNAASLTLSGGTFSTGATTGFNETLGTLDLNTAASLTLALGTGVHTLTFANSSAIDWTGSTLTITGWTGTAGSSGTAGKIFFGSNASGLTAGQLSQINFSGYSNGATILSTGEIVAVPEPSTWALLAFSLTSVVVLRRRRN